MGHDVVESCRREGSKVVRSEGDFLVEDFDLSLQDSVEETVLVAEVHVDQTLVAAGTLCDAVNASTGQAELGELLGRGSEQQLPGGLSITGTTSRRCSWLLHGLILAEVTNC